MKKLNVIKNRLTTQIATGVAVLLAPVCALAEADVSTIQTAVHGLLSILIGPIAKSLAVVAIAGMGYLTLAGKMAWQKAMMICFGIGIIFGAPQIASILGAS
jgi:type IV secretion system protein VirB2